MSERKSSAPSRNAMDRSVGSEAENGPRAGPGEWTAWGLYLSRFRPLATEAPSVRITLLKPSFPAHARPSGRALSFSDLIGTDSHQGASQNPASSQCKNEEW